MASASPWSTVVGDANGRLTVITSSPILRFSKGNPHITQSRQ
jgi:hypothetical protein